MERANRRSPDKVLAAFGDAVFVANNSQTRNGQLSTPEKPDEPWQKALQDIQASGERPDSFSYPLFYAKIELANLATIAGPDSLLATGADATREKLESTDLTRYAILHFATHGIFDPKRPEFSGLLLSTDGRTGTTQNVFVTIQDVYALQTRRFGF